ncbi:CDPK-related kinase 4 [Platanthera guangdongensis]|uniref:CDPK-related kinase 4 n=1 Tax=Platanthera guangdongensis TaxID=2320717 RepID=A0ABR2LDI2_9ASPA
MTDKCLIFNGVIIVGHGKKRQSIISLNVPWKNGMLWVARERAGASPENWRTLKISSQGRLEPLSNPRMDFEEFCAAAISLYQLEALKGWEQMAVLTFEYFEQEGNKVITVEELAQVGIMLILPLFKP